MKAFAPSLLVAVLAAAIAGCAGPSGTEASSTAAGNGAAQEIVHPQGTTTVHGVPAKVIVTDWASFDTLTALGVPVAGVPGTVIPPHLADNVDPAAVKVGTMQEPDAEAIAAAAPDLILIGGRSRTAYPTLSKIAPTVDTSLDNTDIIAGLKANLALYGEVFQRQQRAAELSAALDAKVEQARAAAQGKGSGLVIVTNGGRLGIYGPQSRVSWLYSAVGMPSVFDAVDDREHGGDAITFEYLVKTNPDWLFVIDRDAGVGNAGTAKALLDNALLQQTGFWKNDRVVYLDPAAAYVTMHGYDAVNLLLDQVIEAYGRG